MVWPLVLRVALPVALFTLGIGSFLLLGAAVLRSPSRCPGCTIADLGIAVVVGGRRSPRCPALASSLIARRRGRAVLPPAPGGGAAAADGADERPPGVLFLQIDGLAYDIARRAVRDGSMPTFAAWLRAGSHRLTYWHTDWSSQTGAAVCGILHGSNDDILGFRWYEKDRDHIPASRTRRTPPRWSGGTPTAAACSPGTAPAAATCSPATPPHISLTMSSLPHVVPAAVAGGSGAPATASAPATTPTSPAR